MTSSPQICGFYSITSDAEYEDTASSLRYFIQPRLPINLNWGMEHLKTKPDGYYQEKMDRILTFIVKHKRELLNEVVCREGGERLIPSTQYITYRGILRMIMCSTVSPYPWNIIATKYKGNIYLCQYTSPEEIENDKKRESTWTKFINYGPMFEHNCLSQHPDKKPDTSEACDAGVQFFCVFKRMLANRQFLYAGEMDGTDSKTPLDPNFRNWKPNQFIELKMNCELNTQSRVSSFENDKVHRIWAQSYLTGVERVYIGFRDNRGIVKQIKCYSTDELGKLSKKNWRGPMKGFEYLEFFLNKVETDLKDIDCPYTTIKYSYNKFEGLSWNICKGETPFSLLPKWYLKEMSDTT